MLLVLALYSAHFHRDHIPLADPARCERRQVELCTLRSLTCDPLIVACIARCWKQLNAGLCRNVEHVLVFWNLALRTSRRKNRTPLRRVAQHSRKESPLSFNKKQATSPTCPFLTTRGHHTACLAFAPGLLTIRSRNARNAQ